MSTELYQEVLLQHSRRPRNFGPLATATHRAEGVNAVCGDEVTVEVEVEGGTVKTARFTGSACAICTASASILTMEVAGAAEPQARMLATGFREFAISGALPEALAGRPRLEALGSVHRFPQRVKCATLPWETFLAALAQPVS